MVCSRGKNPMGRLECAVWRYAEDFLHTLNWNAAARKTPGKRTKILESMARTQEDDDDIMSKKEEGRGGSKEGKVASQGFFNTPALRAYCILAPTNSRIHLQRRHASYRCARPLPAKAGTTPQFCQWV
jgi:hypothetical protein